MKKISTALSAFALILVTGATGCSCTCVANVTGMNHKKAEKAAATWATQMGLKVKGVSCTDNDSDDDGYVSCTVSAERPDGSIELVPIECAAALTLNDGCKSAKVIKPSR